MNKMKSEGEQTFRKRTDQRASLCNSGYGVKDLLQESFDLYGCLRQ